MTPPALLCCLVFLLVGADEHDRTALKARVAPARAAAEKSRSAPDYLSALEAAWRADDWVAGRALAEQAQAAHPDHAPLLGPVARALWRAGRLSEAEAVAERIKPDAADATALAALAHIALARCDFERAGAAAARLEGLRERSAEELNAVVAVRMARNQLDGLGPLLRELERKTDPKRGYPEDLLGEVLEGALTFFEAIGFKPVNQIAQHGSAPMSAAPLINLPSCWATINGKGPYRLVIDTGGSVLLSLDREVASEIGLKSLGTASIHGVGGKEESSQALADELRIGDIVGKRVMTRIFDARAAMANAADGILGTGVFADGRLTLDFAGARLVVAPSSATPAPGVPVDLRIVSDSKLIAAVPVNRTPIVALFDSGADAVLLSPSRLRRLFPDEPVQELPVAGMGVGQGGKQGVTLGPGVNFTLAGREYENYGGLGLSVLDDVLSPFMGVQIDLLVGMPVFRELKSMTIDFPRCRMWMERLP